MLWGDWRTWALSVDMKGAGWLFSAKFLSTLL